MREKKRAAKSFQINNLDKDYSYLPFIRVFAKSLVQQLISHLSHGKSPRRAGFRFSGRGMQQHPFRPPVIDVPIKSFDKIIEKL